MDKISGARAPRQEVLSFMTKIDIFSGFLGAGKTTLIKKLIAEAYTGEKIVLIENEFGEIAIDGGFLKDSGVQINEMNSGCICCSLVGDFADALQKVLEQFHPDRILIEPSGVGKLSDVIRAVQGVQSDELVLNGFTTVVDANKCKMYMKNFGEFFNNQVENASAIILSRTEGIRPEKLDAAVALLREKNPTATIVTTPWTELDGKQILETMERRDTLSAELEHLKAEAAEEDDEDEHEHHHEHHYDEHGVCSCGHHHHHDHDADEVFTSWGKETAHKYSREDLDKALHALDEGAYGMILRAKGIVDGGDTWYEFDMVPGEHEIRPCGPDVTGKLCVIGSQLKEHEIAELFHV